MWLGTDVHTIDGDAAGSFLAALSAHDFGRLADALDDDAHLSALLPGGFREWRGATAIAAIFQRWFGDVTEFEVVDASTACFGPRLQLSWRIRQRGDRFGAAPVVVEQHAYADVSDGRIRSLSLLCSGYLSERTNV